MRKFYADIRNARSVDSIPVGAVRLWENSSFAVYYIYTPSVGKVDWILVNKTQMPYFVSLLRGAILNINGESIEIPQYVFGNAFAEVYYANGLSMFVENLNDIPIYSLAVLKTGDSKKIIGFVFSLPANGIIQVPEYGFTNLQMLSAELLSVEPQLINLYAIIYNYNEIYEYYQESGVMPSAPYDPYIARSFQFSIAKIGTIMTERIILEIPTSDIQQASSLIDAIKRFFKAIRHDM